MQPSHFSRNDLKRLIDLEGGPHLSLYLPAPQHWDPQSGDRPNLLGLIRDARSILREYWMSESSADEFLDPVREFSQSAIFQSPRSYGIAVFLCDGLFECFACAPGIEQQLFVGRTFLLRPVINGLEHLDRFYVLSLSENEVALYLNENSVFERLSVAALEEDFRSYASDLIAQPHRQAHTASVGVRGKQGKVFHGQGGIRENQKDDLQNYLTHVDRSIHAILNQYPGTPLILAGVEELTAMYRSVSHCKSILTESINGNVEHFSESQLRERAMAIADREHARRVSEVAEQIREHDVPCVSDSESVLKAASEARIATLLVDQTATLYGQFHVDRAELKELKSPPSGDPADRSHDLIEWAITQTLRSGGDVHLVPPEQMPVERPMAASLRF